MQFFALDLAGLLRGRITALLFGGCLSFPSSDLSRVCDVSLSSLMGLLGLGRRSECSLHINDLLVAF